MSVLTQNLPPFVDPSVEYVGVGKLRQRMTTDDLRSLKRPLIVMGATKPTDERTAPVAVLISYAQYLEMQEAILWRFRDKQGEVDRTEQLAEIVENFDSFVYCQADWAGGASVVDEAATLKVLASALRTAV